MGEYVNLLNRVMVGVPLPRAKYYFYASSRLCQQYSYYLKYCVLTRLHNTLTLNLLNLFCSEKNAVAILLPEL